MRSRRTEKKLQGYKSAAATNELKEIRGEAKRGVDLIPLVDLVRLSNERYGSGSGDSEEK